MRCIGCHTDCGKPPEGFDGTCTVLIRGPRRPGVPTAPALQPPRGPGVHPTCGSSRSRSQRLRRATDAARAPPSPAPPHLRRPPPARAAGRAGSRAGGLAAPLQQRPPSRLPPRAPTRSRGSRSTPSPRATSPPSPRPSIPPARRPRPRSRPRGPPAPARSARSRAGRSPTARARTASRPASCGSSSSAASSRAFLSIAPETGRIASLFLARPAPPARYVVASRFREQPITVGAAPYLLDGTLTLPAGPGPFPAAVLVHGSGPNDRDSTVGSNKIFKDLAEGLASAGIAVLRYDKRTFQYGDQLPPTRSRSTRRVLDDAVAAARALAARPEIDAGRLFVIGHSLGGLLAPEVAARAGDVAGVVLLAPPGRSPWDIIRSQMRYLGAPRETRAALERAIIENDFGGASGMLGMPHAYWQDLESHDGVAMAAALGKPVLGCHGDRDYQVTAEDLAIWRRGLARRPPRRGRDAAPATTTCSSAAAARPTPPSTSSPATSTIA